MDAKQFIDTCCANNYDDVKEMLQTDDATLDNCKKALDFVILSATKTNDMVNKLRIVGILVTEHPSILTMKNGCNNTPIELVKHLIKDFYDIRYKMILDKLNSLYLVHNNIA
jgi:hypothetical protein